MKLRVYRWVTHLGRLTQTEKDDMQTLSYVFAALAAVFSSMVVFTSFIN